MLIGVYFLEPILAFPDTEIAAQGSGLIAWSPSYWFLGLFQQLNGSPALALLAQTAWVGLAAAVSGTALAYTLSYFRSLRKIVEEPDILPGSGGALWLPPLGKSLQTAIVQFGISHVAAQPPASSALGFLLRGWICDDDLARKESPAF